MHTYYEYSVLALKLGMTEWYQSLVRRIILERLFTTKNYFYSIPLQNHKSTTYLVWFLALISPSSFEKLLPISSNHPQKFWHLHVHIFASKHLNEVWRCNEGPTKDEALLS
jgi:hypothetical protein